MKTVSLPETKLRRVVEKAMAEHWLMTWHEDREISPGVPDLHYVMKSSEPHRVGWIELKAIDKQLTKTQRLSVEPSQHQYLRKWGPHMPIHFMVRVQERIFIVPAKYSREVSLVCCRADLAAISDLQFDAIDIADHLPAFLREITRI